MRYEIEVISRVSRREDCVCISDIVGLFLSLVHLVGLVPSIPFRQPQVTRSTHQTRQTPGILFPDTANLVVAACRRLWKLHVSTTQLKQEQAPLRAHRSDKKLHIVSHSRCHARGSCHEIHLTKCLSMHREVI